MRSSPGTNAATTLGGVKKVSPRFLELVAVTPGASVRLLMARFGIAELLGSGAFTAMSASPPPGATPRLLGVRLKIDVLRTDPMREVIHIGLSGTVGVA